MREYEVITAISGRDDAGDVKAGTQMFHDIYGSDESIREVDTLYIQKPEIRIFKDADNIVKIDFVYDYPDDEDLIAQYMFLESFFSPQNSVKYSSEEFHTWVMQDNLLAEGRVIPEEKLQVIYLDALVINIISLTPRGKYTVETTDKPLFYSLVPARPGDSPTILRLIFQAQDVKFRVESDETVSGNLESVLNEEINRHEV